MTASNYSAVGHQMSRDPDLRKLSFQARGLLFMMVSHPETLAPLAILPRWTHGLAQELGATAEDLTAMLDELTEAGYVRYSDTEPVILLPLTLVRLTNPSIVSGMKKLIPKVWDCELRTERLGQLHDLIVKHAASVRERPLSDDTKGLTPDELADAFHRAMPEEVRATRNETTPAATGVALGQQSTSSNRTEVDSTIPEERQETLPLGLEEQPVKGGDHPVTTPQGGCLPPPDHPPEGVVTTPGPPPREGGDHNLESENLESRLKNLDSREEEEDAPEALSSSSSPPQVVDHAKDLLGLLLSDSRGRARPARRSELAVVRSALAVSGCRKVYGALEKVGIRNLVRGVANTGVRHFMAAVDDDPPFLSDQIHEGHREELLAYLQQLAREHPAFDRLVSLARIVGQVGISTMQNEIHEWAMEVAA